MASTYYAYGLRIRSAVSLPGLPADGRDADVAVTFGAVAQEPPPGAPGEVRIAGSEREGLVYWDEVGSVLVRRGREIIVDLLPGADEENLRALLLGAALGVLLTQRGMTALHASAVALAGRAVAFLGGAGCGKSTLAAALHARGHPVVTDDLTAIRVDDGTALVLPGFPQLKLWPETAAHLGDNPETLARARPGVAKRIRPARKGFSGKPLPVACAYVLADDARTALERVRPREAAIELLRHSWAPRTVRAAAPSAQLHRCAAVAAAVPVVRLRKTRSLAGLETLAEAVEQDAWSGRE